MTTSARTTNGDLTRAAFVTISEITCVIGSLVGAGVLGGPAVAESAGGALAADATLLAPAGPAFAIWSVIYLGLAAYTVVQWLPGRLPAALHRRIGWWVAASMLLNAGWLLVVRAGWLPVSVVIIIVLTLVLGVVVRRRSGTASAHRLDAVVVDGTIGLYVGWVSVATCANVTAWLITTGIRPAPGIAQLAAVLVLVAALGIGLVLIRTGRGNPAITLAMVWGIGWIAFGRLSGAPPSVITGVAAIVVAVVLLTAGIFGFVRRVRPGQATGQSTDSSSPGAWSETIR
ncbi:tryptophan-rich sensory protein [Nakamurella sp.]|uniref:tryptophan-rich sensory protein n=1 Tax=Nakamurella sp. TaxID=1869182 RepID=UPI0037839B62